MPNTEVVLEFGVVEEALRLNPRKCLGVRAPLSFRDFQTTMIETPGTRTSTPTQHNGDATGTVSMATALMTTRAHNSK